MSQQSSTTSPLLAAIASAIIPGAGYLLLGEKLRALIAGGGIILLFALGVFIAGARVVSVPGYGEDGYPKYVEFHPAGRNNLFVARYVSAPCVQVHPADPTSRSGPYIVTRQNPKTGAIEDDKEPTYDPPIRPSQWVMFANPLSQLGDNIPFLGQMLNGPLCAAGGYLSIKAAQSGNVPESHSRLVDIGTLYTAIAGMLNLMVIVDSYARAERRRLA